MSLTLTGVKLTLWLILSVAWIIGVGVVTWRTFSDGLASYCDLPATNDLRKSTVRGLDGSNALGARS